MLFVQIKLLSASGTVAVTVLKEWFMDSKHIRKWHMMDSRSHATIYINTWNTVKKVELWVICWMSSFSLRLNLIMLNGFDRSQFETDHPIPDPFITCSTNWEQSSYLDDQISETDVDAMLIWPASTWIQQQLRVEISTTLKSFVCNTCAAQNRTKFICIHTWNVCQTIN